MIKKTYINPYLTSAFSWLSVLILYNLGWSNLYPPISIELLAFFIINILACGFIGFYLSYKGYITYKKIEYNLNKIKKLSIIYILANIAEIIYSRKIPIIAIINGELDNSDFGIPIIHPLIITFGIFLGLYIFHMIISNDTKKRIILLPYFILSFIGVTIIFGRGLMFMTFFGCCLIYIMSTSFNKKILLPLTLLGIFILYLFGLAGNIRIGETGVRITTIGQATEKFENSYIPSEFFWSYIYFSSPIANLEYNLQTDKIHNIDKETLKKLYISEIIPQFISNKIIPDNQTVEPNLITKALNVCSVYTRCYSIAGWTGIIIMLIYIFFYIFTILLIIPIKSQYFIVTITILNMLMVGNVFDNMMNYLLSYTIFYPIFFTIKEKIKFIISNE